MRLFHYQVYNLSAGSRRIVSTSGTLALSKSKILTSIPTLQTFFVFSRAKTRKCRSLWVLSMKIFIFAKTQIKKHPKT